MLTPRASSPRPQTATVHATMAIAGPTLASDARGPLGEAQRSSSGLSPRCAQKQEGDRRDADRRGDGIDVAEVRQQRVEDLQQALAVRADAEQRAELAGGDLHGRPP